MYGVAQNRPCEVGLMYHDPYGAQAIKIQFKIDEVLNDSSLPEDAKSPQTYNDVLQDYKFTMSKSTQSTNPLLNLPVYQNALATRTTILLPISKLTRRDPLPSSSSENIVCDRALVQAIPSTSISRSQKLTQSLAVRHLTPPETIAKPSDTPLTNSAKEKGKDHLLSVVITFLYLLMTILEEMMEIQNMGKVLYLSLTMRSQFYKGDLNIKLGDV